MERGKGKEEREGKGRRRERTRGGGKRGGGEQNERETLVITIQGVSQSKAVIERWRLSYMYIARIQNIQRTSHFQPELSHNQSYHTRKEGERG